MNITIVGTGYVGLVAAACFADNGNQVVGLDVDANKIARLNRGETPIYEPGLTEILDRVRANGRARFTTNYAEAVKHADALFLCLPTPPMEDGSADLSYVLGAAREIAKHLDSWKLIISKSTVPVGTCGKVRQAIADVYKGDFSVASNPEFLKEGAAIDDFLKPDRVVTGVTDDRSWELLQRLYEPFVRTGAPIIRMDPASAELTKYAANGFLAIKISFMNEIARLCEKTGADVDLVRAGISKDARIGSAFLFAGIGYGGSCFPKDTRALAQTARDRGTACSLVEAAEAVNQDQKKIMFEKISAHFAKSGESLKGKRIAIWGLAFKPRTDDIREAPALTLIESLLQAGATVSATDPEAENNVRKIFGDKIEFAADEYAAVTGADALALCTEWNEFRMPDWKRVHSLMRQRAVFDGRNIYRPEVLRELGFTYHGIGRG